MPGYTHQLSDGLIQVFEAVTANVSDIQDKTLYLARSKTNQQGECAFCLYATKQTCRAVKQ